MPADRVARTIDVLGANFRFGECGEPEIFDRSIPLIAKTVNKGSPIGHHHVESWSLFLKGWIGCEMDFGGER